MPEERRINEEKKSKPPGYVKDVLENLDCVFRKTVLRCTKQNLTSAAERIKNLVILMYLGIIDNHIYTLEDTCMYGSSYMSTNNFGIIPFIMEKNGSIWGWPNVYNWQ